MLKLPKVTTGEIALLFILKFSCQNSRFQNFRFSRVKLRILQAFEVGLFALIVESAGAEKSIGERGRSLLRCWRTEPVGLQKFKQSAKN